MLARKKLEESEDRFRQLADVMPQIVWAARPEGTLDYYNERWYQFTGFERDQGGDQSWLPVLQPNDAEHCLAACYHSVSTGEDFKLENRFLNRLTGKYIWFLGQARPVRGPDGKITRWYGSCTDIDQLKSAEQQVVDVLESVNGAFFSIDTNWNDSLRSFKKPCEREMNFSRLPPTNSRHPSLPSYYSSK